MPPHRGLVKQPDALRRLRQLDEAAEGVREAHVLDCLAVRLEQPRLSEALDRMVRDRIAKIEAELKAKDPNYRGLDYWIEQVKAERQAEREAENAA